MTKLYNTSIRNIEYRLRRFKDSLPKHLAKIISDKEDVIIDAIRNNQLYQRGINGKGQKIMDYKPYKPSTIKRKLRKGQPTTRVTLKDTGNFHKSMVLVFDDNGFYVTATDDVTKYLVKKYGDEIFRLTDKNLNRILKSHIQKELVKLLKAEIKNGKQR